MIRLPAFFKPFALIPEGNGEGSLNRSSSKQGLQLVCQAQMARPKVEIMKPHEIHGHKNLVHLNIADFHKGQSSERILYCKSEIDTNIPFSWVTHDNIHSEEFLYIIDPNIVRTGERSYRLPCHINEKIRNLEHHYEIFADKTMPHEFSQKIAKADPHLKDPVDSVHHCKEGDGRINLKSTLILRFHNQNGNTCLTTHYLQLLNPSEITSIPFSIWKGKIAAFMETKASEVVDRLNQFQVDPLPETPAQKHWLKG